MKQKMICLLTAVAILLGARASAYAQEVSYYSCDTLIATKTDDRLEFEYTDDNGNFIELWIVGGGEFVNEVNEHSVAGAKVNGNFVDYSSFFAMEYQDGYILQGGFGMNNGTEWGVGYYFTPVEVPESGTLVSTGFTGSAVSDQNKYELYLAGYFEKELSDGVHILSASDINLQTISIVAYSKTNGEKRVMTQSTIEEMSVTVSSGLIVEVTIRGRVQTSGSTLDRYTATIQP